MSEQRNRIAASVAYLSFIARGGTLDRADWETFTAAEQALERLVAVEPADLTEEDWAEFAEIQLAEERINGNWAGEDERMD